MKYRFSCRVTLQTASKMFTVCLRVRVVLMFTCSALCTLCMLFFFINMLLSLLSLSLSLSLSFFLSFSVSLCVSLAVLWARSRNKRIHRLIDRLSDGLCPPLHCSCSNNRSPVAANYLRRGGYVFTVFVCLFVSRITQKETDKAIFRKVGGKMAHGIAEEPARY